MTISSGIFSHGPGNCPAALRFAAIAAMAVGLALHCAGAAAQQTFTLVPGSSSLTASGYVVSSSYPLAAQQPGSNTTSYSGTIVADVSPSGIQFVSGSSVVAANQPFALDPDATANYGLEDSLPTGTLYITTEFLKFGLTTSATLPVSAGGMFSVSSGMEMNAITGTVSYTGAGFTPENSNRAGQTETNAATSPASLIISGLTETLTLPIQATYDFTAVTANDSALIVTGQLVATATLSPPVAAYWAGSVDGMWTTDNNGVTNWRTDATGATDTQTLPAAMSDVYFTTSNHGSNLTTTLGSSFSIKGLTFTSDATNPVSIGGGNTLTIGADGLTMQAGAATPTITAPVALGANQSWTIGGSSPVLVGGSFSTKGFTLTKAGVGNLMFSGSQTFGAGTAIDVNAGTLQYNSPAAAVSVGAGASITVAAGATLDLASTGAPLSDGTNFVNVVNNSTVTPGGGFLVTAGNQRVGTVAGTGNTVVAAGSLTAYQIVQNSLTIASGATVTLAPSGSGSTTNPGGPNNYNFSSTLNSLSIAGTTGAWSGTLDIGNNGLVLAYGTAANDPYATIDNMIETGFDAAHWDGQGITSSLGRAAANSHTPLNIGLEDFTPGKGNFSIATFIVFEGQTVTTNAILIRLTYMDDIIMAGDMSVQDAASDALIFAANYGSGTTWNLGDLEHTGLVGSADALLFAANYATGLPSLDGTTGADAALGGNEAAVPEPASMALGAMGALGAGRCVCRRRKKQDEERGP